MTLALIHRKNLFIWPKGHKTLGILHWSFISEVDTDAGNNLNGVGF